MKIKHTATVSAKLPVFTSTNTGNDICKQVCSTYKNTWDLKGSENGILHYQEKNTEEGVTVIPCDSQVQAAQTTDSPGDVRDQTEMCITLRLPD